MEVSRKALMLMRVPRIRPIIVFMSWRGIVRMRMSGRLYVIMSMSRKALVLMRVMRVGANNSLIGRVLRSGRLGHNASGKNHADNKQPCQSPGGVTIIS